MRTVGLLDYVLKTNNNCLFIHLDLYKRIHSIDKQGPTTTLETVNPPEINKYKFLILN